MDIISDFLAGDLPLAFGFLEGVFGDVGLAGDLSPALLGDECGVTLGEARGDCDFFLPLVVFGVVAGADVSLVVDAPSISPFLLPRTFPLMYPFHS